MPAKSKIERLPDEQRSKIDKLLQSPTTTLDDIVEMVAQMGIDDGISRSSLHRRQVKLSVVGERIRRSREMAESLVSRFGDEPDAKVARLNMQFLHSAIMDILSEADEDGAPVTLEPKQVAALARAVSELARAEKADSERTIQMQHEAAKRAATTVIDGVQAELKKNKQPGLSSEALANIWKGVGLPAPGGAPKS